MQSVWNINLDDYMEVVKMAQANGKKAGDSIEEEFIEYAKLKGLKPYASTELTRDEIIAEITSKDKSVLDIKTDDKGKQEIKIYKKKG